MRLIGTYASPFVRRVGVTLHLYGMAFEHAPMQTDADRERITPLSPLGRIPALVLADGTALFDSGAIIDHLDEMADDAALVARSGAARRKVLGLTALGHGTAEKYVAAWYEQSQRPESHVWKPWLDRLEAQIVQGLTALDAALEGSYLAGERISHADVMAVCAYDGVAIDMPHLAGAGDFPKLRGLRDRLSEMDAFSLTAPE